MLKKLAWVFGVVLIVIGVCGFVPSFSPQGLLFDMLLVDAMLSAVYLISGVLAAGAGWRSGYARLYFKVFGIVYAIFTVVGFLQSDTVFGLFAVNMADNILNLVIAAVALWAGFGSKEGATMSQSSAAM